MRATIADLTKLVAQISAVAAEQSKQLTLTQDALRNTHRRDRLGQGRLDARPTCAPTSASLEQLSRDLKETNAQVQGVIDEGQQRQRHGRAS